MMVKIKRCYCQNNTKEERLIKMEIETIKNEVFINEKAAHR